MQPETSAKTVALKIIPFSILSWNAINGLRICAYYADEMTQKSAHLFRQ